MIKCCRKYFKMSWNLQLQIIWHWLNCEAHWFQLSSLLSSFKEHSNTRIAHAEVQWEGQQEKWDLKNKSGKKKGSVITCQGRFLSRISFFFSHIAEGRASNSKKPFSRPC